MATIFRTRPTADTRSGGKITRGRRVAAARTPYDRPPPPSPPASQSPNWITGVVFPATRMIASGAGRLISSVFGPDSSSSSSEDSDTDSENDVDSDNDDYDTSPVGNDGLRKNVSSSSETIKVLKEAQPIVWKSETKRVIEKLLMQETFSREECDRLTNIINSRVLDHSTIEDGEAGKASELPRGAVGNDTLDLYSKAVMEAKKWLKEKKVGSSSKSDMDYASNLAELPHVVDGEVGSPVDMAKLYMRARPPWASPSLSPVDIKTPLSVGIELFKEGTPYSIGDNSFSSLKQKKDPLATGSWNIQEELRRVRSKATEDMLRTLPSAKTDLSPSALEPKIIFNSSVSQAGGVCASHATQDLEMTKDGSCNGVLLSNLDTRVSEENEVVEPIQMVGGVVCKSNHSTIMDLSPKKHSDTRSSEKNSSPMKVVSESRGTQTANGDPTSAHSLSAGTGTRKNPRPSPKPANLGQGKLTNSVPGEENCELLSEASVEVPMVNETNSIASGSQNSSSMHYEESVKEPTQLNTRRGLAGKAGGAAEKQQGRKLSTYNKRGRGRGK